MEISVPYSPTYSELIFDLVDDATPKAGTAEFRIPVSPFSTTELALADYIASATGAASYFGVSDVDHISSAGIARIRLSIDLGIDPIASAATAELRNVWEMTTGDADPFRRSIAGRNLQNALYSTGTKKQLANMTYATWVDFLVFFAGGVDAINMIDVETGDNTNFAAGRGTVRARQRPRV